MPKIYTNDSVLLGDCREKLRGIPPNTFSAVVTDPPYGLKFMGREWDHGVSGIGFWTRIMRVCKPGAILLAFGGTRTYHRLACAIEDAGWEIRDCLAWVYGSGFPKSLDVSKAIDKAAIVKCGECDGIGLYETDNFGEKRACEICGGSGKIKGVEREVVGVNQNVVNRPSKDGAGFRGEQDVDITAPATPLAQLWDGWGTALKPAYEPIVLAMKPLDGTFAENALEHGVAGLNVDGSRIKGPKAAGGAGVLFSHQRDGTEPIANPGDALGRWPANLIHDGSDEVLGVFPEDSQRFFYCAKAGKSERTSNGKVENKHPTVKPLKLMEYLVKLVTMPEGTYILDPFCGSGSTLLACKRLGVEYMGIDSDPSAVQTAVQRLGND